MNPTSYTRGEPIVLDVPDAAGVVTLENWKSPGAYIAVGGARQRRSFTSKTLVPTLSGGAVELKIRGGMPGFVRVFLGSKTLVDTGRAPVWMWVLVFLPVLLLLLVQGIIGLGISLGLVFATRAVVTRDSMSKSTRIFMALALFFAGVAMDLTLYSAFIAAEA